jgi:hypothetical protein
MIDKVQGDFKPFRESGGKPGAFLTFRNLCALCVLCGENFVSI